MGGAGAIAAVFGRAGAIRTVLAACAVVVLAAGCGFQLRGSHAVPFDSIYVVAPEKSELAFQLRRGLMTRGGAKLAPSVEQAQARLILLDETREKNILTLDAAGRVREFQLTYRMIFRVQDAAGRDLLARSEILVKRDITFSDSAVLAKETEEALLYRDMQNDLVDQTLRRLATMKQPG